VAASLAFDLTYSFDPVSRRTRTHQIKLNYKQDDFSKQDLLEFAAYCDVKQKKAHEIVNQTVDAFNGLNDILLKEGVYKRSRDSFQVSAQAV